jgi:hypothetical protein
MALGEESAISSNDEETQKQAIQELQELVSEHFPAGVDGTNAIESLKGIIDDPALYKEIKASAKEDPDGCVRPLVKQWLENNAPEVLDQLDFGDMVDEPAADQGGDQTAPEEEPQMAGDDPDERNRKNDKDDLPFEPDDDPMDKDEFGNTIKHKARHLARKGMRQAMDVKELAEFINSFYDRNTGTFPKGPEGICTMVGKKFGEQAEQVARKFVERMAPHQEQGAEQMQELSRMRELAGLKNEAGDDSEGVEDLIAAADEEYNQPGRHIDNLQDVMNATIDADDSPEYEKARAIINRYLELITNTDVDHYDDDNDDPSAPAIGRMTHGDIARHIREYDLGDHLAAAINMLTKVAGQGESVSPELEDIRRLSGIAQGIGY